MIQKVVKYGNSVAVVLPKDSATAAGIEVGSLVATTVENGRVIIQPVEIVPRLSPDSQQFVDDLYPKRSQVFKALGE